MSYADFDTHPFLGYPVGLYEFFVNGNYYRYVHCDVTDTPLTIDGVDWLPANISRSRFARGIEVARAGIDIVTNLDLPLHEVFDAGMPETRINVSVYRVHLTDPDLEKYLVWDGGVSSRKLSGKQVTLKCEPPEVYLKSVGLRRRIQTICPYALYGAGCKAEKALHLLSVTVSAISDDKTQVTVSPAPGPEFAGGMIVATFGSQERLRYITASSGGILTMLLPATWAFIGQSLAAYPGCDKSTATCSSLFNNLDNYGGFPAMPKNDLFNTRIY